MLSETHAYAKQHVKTYEKLSEGETQPGIYDDMGI